VTVSFDAWKTGKVKPATYDVPVPAPQAGKK
jgi:hypothetical protein